ncbi:unnamed protein product, partial [Ectocarpus sp. 4 AP-2014]
VFANHYSSTLTKRLPLSNSGPATACRRLCTYIHPVIGLTHKNTAVYIMLLQRDCIRISLSLHYSTAFFFAVECHGRKCGGRASPIYTYMHCIPQAVLHLCLPPPLSTTAATTTSSNRRFRAVQLATPASR